jgi:hypothetical protein
VGETVDPEAAPLAGPTAVGLLLGEGTLLVGVDVADAVGAGGSGDGSAADGLAGILVDVGPGGDEVDAAAGRSAATVTVAGAIVLVAVGMDESGVAGLEAGAGVPAST